MPEFFLAELRRFRNGAAAFGLANLVALTVLQQIVDVPNAPVGLHIIMLGFYMLSGLALAVFQFGSYRQPSRWIWLQHRPVHRARLLAALVLAAVALIALAVALPLCAALLMQDHYTRGVIDARHYAGAAYLALSALCAWLAGGYIMLHRSRWAFVVLVLPVVLTMRLATAATVLGLTVACVAVLLALLYTVFRPNRSAADDTVATAASAIPLQVCCYVALLWAGSMLYQAGLVAAGAHPQVREPALAGGLTETRRFKPVETLRAGLAGSADPRAAAWRAALDPHAIASLAPIFRQYGVRDLMTTQGMARFVQGETIWTFSHDRMLFRGVDARNRTDQGVFGAGGPGTRERFDTVPETLGGIHGVQWFFDAHNLYRVDEPGMRLRHVLRVDGQEQLGAVTVLEQRILVLTNHRLALLAPATGTPSSSADVRLPLPFGDLDRVYVAQVAEGMLVSFVYGHREFDGALPAQQITYLVDPSARVQEVGRRDLAHDFAPLYEHRAWWLSPALHALVELPDLLIDAGAIPDYGLNRFAPLLQARPATVWAAALAAALLAGAGAVWWTRRTHLGRTARAVWCLACLLLGVPALLSLMILQPRLRGAPVAAAAPERLPVRAG
ncbi:hypothetical protein [Massilia sp. Root335]|uniref:hypothetical protein n=1 Tax=Massilia sp. Root335 TaxID=1736517 RepID=UPI0007003200|nr:hypothetical protein [Massilia sp. Root335]KQV40094.1 hypothetical protein ASC93_18850 [Massilia sp. Root335]